MVCGDAHPQPSTPVRTGRPDGTAGSDPDLTFDPCSHRETVRCHGETASPDLRPLFAQGDRIALEHPPLKVPSTPVRTGRPAANRRCSSPRSFDPCSHRGTDKSEGRHPPPRLRPLFAQGGRLQSDPSEPAVSSTPVRTGRPGEQGRKPQRRGFDPCSHRETLRVFRSGEIYVLRPLFAQGDP